MKRRLIVIAAILMMVVSVTACGGQSADGGSGAEAEKEVSMFQDLKPTAFIEATNHHGFFRDASFDVPVEWLFFENAPQNCMFFTAVGAELDLVCLESDETSLDMTAAEDVVAKLEQAKFKVTKAAEEITMTNGTTAFYFEGEMGEGENHGAHKCILMKYDKTLYLFRMITFDNAKTDYTDDFLAVADSVKFGEIEKKKFKNLSIRLPKGWEATDEQDMQITWSPKGDDMKSAGLIVRESTTAVDQTVANLFFQKLSQNGDLTVAKEPYQTMILGKEGFRAVYNFNLDGGKKGVEDVIIPKDDSRLIILTTGLETSVDDRIFVSCVFKSLEY